MKYRIVYLDHRQPDEFEGTLINFNEQTGEAKFDIPGSAKTLVLHGVDEIQESETA